MPKKDKPGGKGAVLLARKIQNEMNAKAKANRERKAKAHAPVAQEEEAPV